MGTINPTLPADGTTADVADVNVPFEAILAVLNGGIDNENIDNTDDFSVNSLSTNDINEGTSAHGVNVDSLNIKDGKLNTNDSVVTSNVTDNAITAPKLSTSAIKAGGTSATSATASISTETTVLSQAVTIPAGGRDAMVIITVGHLGATNTGNRAFVKLKESSTILQSWYMGIDANGWNGTLTAFLSAPSSGSHTYTVTVTRDVGTGTLNWFADGSGATSHLKVLMI